MKYTGAFRVTVGWVTVGFLGIWSMHVYKKHWNHVIKFILWSFIRTANPTSRANIWVGNKCVFPKRRNRAYSRFLISEMEYSAHSLHKGEVHKRLRNVVNEWTGNQLKWSAVVNEILTCISHIGFEERLNLIYHHLIISNLLMALNSKIKSPEGLLSRSAWMVLSSLRGRGNNLLLGLINK